MRIEKKRKYYIRGVNDPTDTELFIMTIISLSIIYIGLNFSLWIKGLL